MRSLTVLPHVAVLKASLSLVFFLLIAIFCLGTPTPAQAAIIDKCLDIDSDETWTSDNVYVVTCDVTVNSDVTLTIQAGTVIKFDGYYTDLFVDGILDVQGTTDNRVVFTSYQDDSYGDDTNDDGAATSPAAGDWGSIRFNNSASTLDYALIQYGGIPSYNGCIYIYNSSPTIEHNIIRHNIQSGIYVENGSPTIKDNTIEDSTYYGLRVNTGSPTVEHNLIRNNKYGIYVDNGSPTIKDNDIEDSSLYGLRVNTGSPTVSDNTFADSGILHLYHSANADPSYSGNTFSGTGGGAINVYGGSISDDITWENIQGLDWPYLVSSDLPINSGGTLRLPAGTVVKLNYSKDLIVDGTLDVQGTASNRVVFTSYQDDSYGGDTNGDGDTTSPAPGDWGSIHINNSANTLDYTLIQYGGGQLYSTGVIGMHNSSPIIEHNIIRYNYKGIFVSNGSPAIKDNNIEGSTEYGWCVWNGSPTVSDNTFTDSGTYHLCHGAPADPSYSGNTFSGTGGGAIFVNVFGGSISDDITWENIQGLNWPYLVYSNLPINNSGTLRLPAGTVVKLNYSKDLIVDGTLDVQGTADNRVVFTSFKDDSYGGDTNGDGDTTSPAPSDWGSIQINNSANTLDYTLIQYGGIGGGGGVYINSSPTVEHNIIRYNYRGLYLSFGSPTIRHNDITGNTDYGVYNNSTGTTTIDAANNWWGHASGPSGVGPGSGDAVSDYVNYTPWLDAPANPISDPIPPSSSILTYLPFVLR